MRIAHYRFSPRPLPTLVTLLLLAALIWLGLWQLDRADQKRALQQAREQAEHGPAVTLQADAPMAAQDLAFRRGTALGHYDRSHQVLLDNRVQNGEAGYDVLTPLHLQGSATAILVDRGWVPVGASREVLPAISAPEGAQKVAGLVSPPPSHGLVIGADTPDRQVWPQVVEYLDLARLEHDLGYRLLPVVLMLDPNEPNGYVRRWELPGLTPERHLGYAFQWFSLAAVLIIVYVVMNVERLPRGEGARD